MANSILSTRISLRYDSYSNWTTKNPVLLKGEAAICVVPANSSTGLNEPALLMKVGEDGVKKFNELPWLSALSADTNEYARLGAAAFEAQIKAWATETSGREYQIVSDPTTGAYSYKLQTRVWVAASGSTAAHWGEWTDVTGSVINLKDIDDRLDVLEGDAATAGSVANAIAVAEAYTDTKIAGLDATVTQTASDDGLALSITEVDGKITAISGSIAANTYDANGAAAQALADAKDYANGILANAIDDLDSSVSADTANGKVLTGVTQADGILTAVTEVALADVAYSGTAADVAIVDTAEKFTATNVEAALAELKDDVAQEASDRANAITAEVSARNNAISAAVNALDATITGMGAGKTIKTLTEEDGVIAATFEDIAIVPSQVTGAGTAITANTTTSFVSADANALPTVNAVEVYVTEAIEDLEGAMHFRGIVIREEGETDIDAIERTITDPEAGDVVVMQDNGYEYIYSGSAWREIGSEGNYATKAELSAEANARKAADILVESNAKSYTDDEIDALTTTESQTAGGDGLALSISQANGLITSISGSIVAETYDAYGSAAAAEANAKAHANGLVAALDGAANATAASGNVYTVLTSVVEEDGVISKGGEVTLAAAAKTGAAADVSVADVNGKFTATNVEAALEELYDDITTAIDGLDGSANATAVDANGRYSVLTSVVESNGVISKGDEVKLEKIATTGNVNDLIQTAGDYLILDGGNASSFSA